MLVAIALAVVAFLAALVALCYDTVDRRFRFPFQDEETGAWRRPEAVVPAILVIAFVAMTVSIVKSVVDITAGRRAAAEAARQWERIRTQISAPEVVIIAEFPEAMLRQRTAGNPEATRLLAERLALVKETPIPPDDCEGLLIARGAGAVSILGDILAGDGGLMPADFSLVIGFFRTGKDLGPFAMSGFDLFDMSMAANAAKAEVRLSFLSESRTFRLSLTAPGDGLASDPETITAAADLPGATVVLEPFTETNAFERDFVSRLVVRDRLSGATYGIDLASVAPAAPDSGWPPHSFVGVLGPSSPACMPAI
jgi:hypothetical protein